MVEYTYDTWGKFLSTSDDSGICLGVNNPFRYRGYYYDTETGLYYLNARYYNPEWGRFINADSYGGSIGGLLSHNVFAYCSNNPVMMSDPSGHDGEAIIAGAIIGAMPGSYVRDILSIGTTPNSNCYGTANGENRNVK